MARSAILAEFGLHGALRKEKNGVRRGSCSGVTEIFAFFPSQISCPLLASHLLAAFSLGCFITFAGSLSSFRVEGGKSQTASGEILAAWGGAVSGWGALDTHLGRSAPNL